MLKSSINIHSWAYFIALLLVAISLPLSKYAMSMSEILLVILWFWSGFSFKIAFRFFKIAGFFSGIYHLFEYLVKLFINNIIDKFGLFFRNPAAMVLSSIFIIHVLGLVHTSDFNYAFKDLRIKLPILLFPVVMSTMYTIKYKQFKILMLFYIAAVFVGTMISLGLIVQGEFVDIRYTSPYISSIRFGLNVSFAFFSLLYFIFCDKWFTNWMKMVFSLTAIWFFFYLMLLESVTSLTAIILVGLLLMIYLVFKIKNFKIRFGILFLVAFIPSLLIWYVADTIKEASTLPSINIEHLDKSTINGNPYIHDTTDYGIEDGKYVGLYICESEMREAWNNRSNVDFNSHPANSHEIKATLIRYLTSKNFRKDESGVKALSDKDIRLIEKGVANYHYVANPGLRVRILKIMLGYEVYQKTGDPGGSSVMQRIEYSKAAFILIKKNIWFGVGTGDLENELYEQYGKVDKRMKTKFMFHAHNQFFAIFIAFGVFGFIWFIVALVYPPVKLGRFTDYFFVVFFIIIMWSMLSDDTLETQAGVTLFAFFYSFLLFGKEKKNAIS